MSHLNRWNAFIFNHSDEKNLSKDDQTETLMQMYKDLEKQLHQERAERKKEEENL